MDAVKLTDGQMDGIKRAALEGFLAEAHVISLATGDGRRCTYDQMQAELPDIAQMVTAAIEAAAPLIAAAAIDAARLALPILERDRRSLVECSSTLVAADGGFEPVPGTLDPEAVEDVAAYDEAIAALRALTEPGP